MVDSKECLFCKIARGEIPAKKVFEDNESIAFLDINPRNPGHTLVIPKTHYETLLDMPTNETGEYFKSVKAVIDLVKEGMNAQGISIASSLGPAAGQVVAHQHFHVIPRFGNEGPVGLEGILPTKRMDEKSLDQIVDVISKATPGKPSPKPAQTQPTSTQAERPALTNMAERPAQSEAPQRKKEVGFGDLEDEEGISFDF